MIGIVLVSLPAKNRFKFLLSMVLSCWFICSTFSAFFTISFFIFLSKKVPMRSDSYRSLYFFWSLVLPGIRGISLCELWLLDFVEMLLVIFVSPSFYIYSKALEYLSWSEDFRFSVYNGTNSNVLTTLLSTWLSLLFFSISLLNVSNLLISP